MSNLNMVQQDFYNVMADFVLLLYSLEKDFTMPGLKEFLTASYIERGYTNEDAGRDPIEILKKIAYNMEISCLENDPEEKRLLSRFLETFTTTLMKNLKQDLFEESHTANNGKFFLNIYRNICGLTTVFSKVFSSPTLAKPLVDIFGFILVEAFNKFSFNPAEDLIPHYDPIMIKSMIHENPTIDFKPFITAVFSVPHKDKHFPRKIFVKLVLFLLKTDLARVEKRIKENGDPKLKKYELVFKCENEVVLTSESFIQSLFYLCISQNHVETSLNTLREIVNYSMLQDGEKGLVIPFTKVIYSALANQGMEQVLEKVTEILLKLADLIDVTEYSYEEKISLLYLLRSITSTKREVQVSEEMYSGVYALCGKWICEILSKFDSNIL